MRQPRCFPPPWTVEEQPACLVVGDRDGQQLAYVCRGRARARKLLTKDEARRIAVNIARAVHSRKAISFGKVVRLGAHSRAFIGECRAAQITNLHQVHGLMA